MLQVSELQDNLAIIYHPQRHPDAHSRLVIQQIAVENPSYRLVVYGDWEKPRHADFGDKEALLKMLRTAMPDIDLSQHFLNPLREWQGSIVFTGEIQLHDRHLGLLGLADHSR